MSSAWPLRAQGGLIDWWTAVERCNLEPFRTALQADPARVDATFEAPGLDPNAPAPDGAYALHRICAGYCDPATTPERRASRRAIVEALLRAGADPARRDAFGETPYELAQQAGNTMLLGLLKAPKEKTP